MDGRWFTPTNAAKPTFTSMPVLVTLTPLPQASTTVARIFEQAPNAMVQAQPEIGQSNRSKTFVPYAHLLVGSAQTIIYLQITLNGQNQNGKNWIGKTTYKRRKRGGMKGTRT